MAYSGLNLGNVKNQNRSSILKLLNDHGPMPRKDLSARLGLTPASLTTLCGELLAQNILFELGEVQQEDKRAGRRKILLGINYAYRQVLSISIEAPATSVTLCDLRGEHCITRRIPTDTSVEPEVFLKRVANVGKALLWENSIGREELLGAGVSVPGPVDREKGVSTHAYRVWDQPVQVTAPLAEALECTVLLENNVKAFAQAELIYGLGRTEENLLLLKWGPGVGSAIIAQGRIYESRMYKSAEIGHVRVEKNGRLCRCGRHGCLEAYASATALIRQAKRAGEQHPESALHGREELTALDVFQAADAGDTAAQAVIDRWCVYVAAGMTDLVNSLAPEMILLGGGVSRQGERILSPIREYVAEHCFGGREGAVPIIAAAKLGNEAGIIGAAAL